MCMLLSWAVADPAAVAVVAAAAVALPWAHHPLVDYADGRRCIPAKLLSVRSARRWAAILDWLRAAVALPRMLPHPHARRERSPGRAACPAQSRPAPHAAWRWEGEGREGIRVGRERGHSRREGAFAKGGEGILGEGQPSRRAFPPANPHLKAAPKGCHRSL